jgi:hypothetical protein
MAQQQIRLKSYFAMSAPEREETLQSFLRAASVPRNGQTSLLDARIREFEVRFEMTSAELHQRLRDGSQRETAEIAKWLFLLEARGEQGEAKG